jgi:hypothetical protein
MSENFLPGKWARWKIEKVLGRPPKVWDNVTSVDYNWKTGEVALYEETEGEVKLIDKVEKEAVTAREPRSVVLDRRDFPGRPPSVLLDFPQLATCYEDINEIFCIPKRLERR